jgi:hypothetical protein
MRNRTKSRRTHKSKHRYHSKDRVAGGGVTPLPLQYFGPSIRAPSAGAGHDLLRASPPTEVRQKIGGKRRKLRKTRKTTGGFVPSIMDGFVAAASRFIVPLALYSGYKLLSRTQRKQGRITRQR